MSAPYSLDLRARVLAAAHDDHLSPGQIAARFRVANSTVRDWLRRARRSREYGADTGHLRGGARDIPHQARRGAPPSSLDRLAFCSSGNADHLTGSAGGGGRFRG